MSFFVYILLCEDSTGRQSYYTGYTNNIPRRFYEHQTGRGALYTRMNKPKKIVYREMFFSRALAMKREAQIKKMSKKQKERLIEK